jgi:fatty-acyl-CoA synthase
MSLLVQPSRPSYSNGPSDVPLLGETIGANLRRTVERFGDRDALVVRHQGYRATYAELWDQVDQAARAFLAAGVERGDRVGIWSQNRHEWVVTQFATARIGAILVTINPAYTSAELRYVLNKAGVSVLAMARGSRRADSVRLLADVRAHCRTLRRTIVIEDDWRGFLAGAEQVGACELAERESKLQFDDPINISSRPGRPAIPRARRSPITTSSTTRTSRRGHSATASTIASACPFPSTTASGW